MKKVFMSVSLAFLMILSSFVASKTTAESSNIMTRSNEKEIKKVVERFISEDYNFNGGQNVFSTVNNENLKQFLTLRNKFKKESNKKDSYKVYNKTFKYDYKKIESKRGIVKVSLDVIEKFMYDIPSATGQEAMTKDNYEIYLEKKDNTYYVVSANDLSENDSEDEETNLNNEEKELNYYYLLQQNLYSPFLAHLLRLHL